MKTHEQIYDFMNDYKIGVISTVTKEGMPEAAIVGFGQTKKLEILIGTNNSTRKYRNLQHNQHVAFTLGGGTTPETVQFEGIARELSSDEMRLVEENYWEKNPFTKKYAEDPGERYFIITPTWIRYTDLRSTPWDVTELHF